MPTVSNTVTDPSGDPIAGVQVVIRLIATIPESTPAAGFLGPDDETILSQIELTTDALGEWSTNLVANSLITPAGTYYLVSERPDVTPRRPAVKYRIEVPDTVGPHWAGDLLTEAPDDLPSAVSVASAVSFNPVGTIAATNVQAAIAEVAAEAGPTVRLVATGAADESAAIVAAMALIPTTGGKLILNGNFLAANMTIPNRQGLVIDMTDAKITKNANGPVFTTPGSGWGKYLTFVHPHIDCAGATYTGSGIAVGASSAFLTLDQGYIIDSTLATLDFNVGGDGSGAQCDVDGTLLTVYQGQRGEANAGVAVIKLPLDATTAPNRGFRGVRAAGCLLVEDLGSQDSRFEGCEARNLNISGTPAKFFLTGSRLSSSGDEIVIRGTQGMITGNAFAGNLRVAVSCNNGTFTGNVIAGDLIFDSGTSGNAYAGNRPTGTTTDSGSNVAGAIAADLLPFAPFPSTFDPRLNSATGTITANRAIFLRTRGSGTITKIGLTIGVQSGNVDVGVYSNSGVGRAARPSARKGSSGSTACPATGYAEITLTAPVSVVAGDWFAIAFDNATASVNIAGPNGGGSSEAQGLSHFQGTAFPLPSTAAVSGTNAVYSVILIGV